MPIEQVQDIVLYTEQITEVPNTPAHVLGLMTLRNRLVPLVSLRGITDTNKIVVVLLGNASDGISVGVRVVSGDGINRNSPLAACRT
jgi:purine-binding chemotaxis protein CheW